jgi:phosphoribosylanthranilate isomerase
MSAIEPSFVVKICGITNEDDARVAIEAGANALGFNSYAKSPRCLSLARASRLAATVPASTLKVGVFVNPLEQDLLDALDQVTLDVLQLHGSHCPASLPGTHRIWRAANAGDPPEHDARFEAYLLDTATPHFGGSGKTFDWTLAAAFPHRAIIAGGLDGDNVARAIETAHPWGVDACSRLESHPGKKDPQRVRHFARAALSATRLHKEITP